MKISVAAIPYYWGKKAYQEFYEKLSKLPVDIVYLGETVCSKRNEMKWQDWLEVAIDLTVAGKQVVLSTMTLIEAASELKTIDKIAKQADYLIEANDTGAVHLANKYRHKFAIGSAINIYNQTTFLLYKKLGMKRWCVPVELGKNDLLSMCQQIKSSQVEIEYQIFGRMALAYSARCFTARHHKLPKDQCQKICINDEQGILVNTQEGDCFAQINGIQTQSAKIVNLTDRWKELEKAGVNILRVVPIGAEDTLGVIAQITQSVANNKEHSLDTSKLTQEYEYCNGYWFQIEGMKFVS